MTADGTLSSTAVSASASDRTVNTRAPASVKALAMTSAIKGKTKAEAEHLFEQFHRLVTGELDPLEAHTLGKLAVFSGVREYPVRVKCASLSWHAMKAALQAPAATVTT